MSFMGLHAYEEASEQPLSSQEQLQLPFDWQRSRPIQECISEVWAPPLLPTKHCAKYVVAA